MLPPPLLPLPPPLLLRLLRLPLLLQRLLRLLLPPTRNKSAQQTLHIEKPTFGSAFLRPSPGASGLQGLPAESFVLVRHRHCVRCPSQHGG